jgi:hypothetical protein
MNQSPPDVPAPVSRKNSGLAVGSLVLGILGLLLLLICIGPLFAIAGAICGHMAYSQIKKSGGMLEGQGLALAGLITSYITIALSVFILPLMMAIAIPNFVKARNTAQRNACINNLRQIDAAKQQWALENNRQREAIPTSADLDKYLPRGFSSLKCPAGGTYNINVVSENPTCSVQGHQLP